MAENRRSSTTQMAELNATLMAQNAQIKNIHKTAQQSAQTTTNVQGELYRQRGVIENNIEKTEEIKGELGKANKITKQMSRRNFCVKAIMWLVILLLFAANIALIIYKLAR